jgi:hypothetical protein
MNQFSYGEHTASSSELREVTTPAWWEKSYHGKRQADGSAEVWIEETKPKPTTEASASGPTRRPLPLCLELKNHSPTGFAWGYGGSGPAQLALAILTDALGNSELALRHYQEFKREIVAGWGDGWSITARAVREFVAKRGNS